MAKTDYIITVDGVDYTCVSAASRKMNTHEEEARQVICSLRYGAITKTVYKGHKVEFKREPPKKIRQIKHIKGTPLLTRRPIGYYSLGRGEI